MIKEFLGWGGYERTPEGFFSWQHLVFVSSLMVIMVLSAFYLGQKNKYKDAKAKNKVLIAAAILIDSFEIFKIVMLSLRSGDAMAWQYNLPLFLCSIQLIAIPIAAFTSGRMKEAALDFVLIFGILGAVLGTYGAAQNYGAYPVLGLDNVVSGITHSISGFASLYIAFSGMTSLKKKNIHLTFAILFGFAIAAFIANKTIGYNYMFLERGDGTPYDVLYSLVGGNPVLYPMGVIVMFLLYILAFYGVYFLIKKKKTSKIKEATEEKESAHSV